ncbi:MAG: PadR family transcriptional regulator [Solirubrobacterales bacterium]
MSDAKAKVLERLLQEPEEPHYGYELMRSTGVKSGSLYPILEQLEGAGWLSSRWEAIHEAQAGRPPRRWYRLTGEGRRAAPDAVDRFARSRADGKRVSWKPGLAT